jgi:GrpB-like predicted nucleotidyltransferase (UPF0157 family)
VTAAPPPQFVIPPTRVDAPVTLVEPDPAWAEWYAHEEDRIRAALGSRALQVAHVGSTSVPGLVAKPVIDVVLAVANSADEAGYVPDLESAGYRLQFREPDWHEHRFLVSHSPRVVQIHVFTVGSSELQRMIRFRDRLRTHPADRELYGRTKRDLAARRWAYVQDYADAKTSVVEEIIGRAEAGNEG